MSHYGPEHLDGDPELMQQVVDARSKVDKQLSWLEDLEPDQLLDLLRTDKGAAMYGAILELSELSESHPLFEAIHQRYIEFISHTERLISSEKTELITLIAAYLVLFTAGDVSTDKFFADAMSLQFNEGDIPGLVYFISTISVLYKAIVSLENFIKLRKKLKQIGAKKAKKPLFDGIHHI